MLAERVGFEPTVPCGITGFQDQLLKPLGHLSELYNIYNQQHNYSITKKSVCQAFFEKNFPKLKNGCIRCFVGYLTKEVMIISLFFPEIIPSFFIFDSSFIIAERSQARNSARSVQGRGSLILSEPWI